MLTNPKDSSVLQLFSDYSTREINTETLSEITKKYSIDVATLFFVEKIYEQEKNRTSQNCYLTALDNFKNEKIEQHLSFLKNYFIVFVPGFRYKHINNGGNFLNQRRLFDSVGICYEMIEIEEAGLVDNNAKIISNRLRELNSLHDSILIISVSKSGLETAIALENMNGSNDISSVKGWINVGGILRGTPVADMWYPPFRRFWMSCGLFFIRKSLNLKALLSDLSYNRCKEKY